MPIARLSVHHVRIPLRRAVRHASHARTETDSLIVCCELTDGSRGWGEGLPRDYVTGETIDDVWSLLQSPHIARPLDAPLRTLPAAVDCLDRLDVLPVEPAALAALIGDPRWLQVQPFVDRGCFGNSLRCAIELAVLDAVCRSLGVPLSEVTQVIAETGHIRQSVDRVRYSGIITAEGGRAQLHAALKLRLYGFRHVKVKVGLPEVNDAARLRAIRLILGRGIDLRVDANAGWTEDDFAPGRLERRLIPGISSIEQPLPHARLAGLADIRGRIDVPIMLDESLCSLIDARRAIDEGLGDTWNIRLSKCGGFVPSLRLAARAHSAGLGYQLGCQVGETGILSAAGRHFATSVANIRFLEGSYDRHLVRERLTREDLTFRRGGVAPALRRPGLGVSLDETALDRVTLRTAELIS